MRMIGTKDLTEGQRRELLRRWNAFPNFVPIPEEQPFAQELIELGLLDAQLELTLNGCKLGKSLQHERETELGR